MAQNNYGGPEKHGGVLQWLPPKHVGTSNGFNQKHFGSGVEEARRHEMKSPPVVESDPPLMLRCTWWRPMLRYTLLPDSSQIIKFTHNSKSRRLEKRRKGRKWAIGGPGMQAIFLGSGPRSSGTGVFLPRCDGPDPISTKIKPAMSPVLLPSHIVQALNLNVSELGQQIIKPQSPDETKNCEKIIIEEKSEKTPKEDDSCLFPDIINLPEEWTY